MSHNGDQYNLAGIRELLQDAFRPRNLRRFCRDRDFFRPILDEFADDHGLADMVDEVIDYCAQNYLWHELLTEVARKRPKQYARLYPKLGESAPPPAPGPAWRLGPVAPTGIADLVTDGVLLLALVGLSAVVLLLARSNGPTPEPTEVAIATGTAVLQPSPTDMLASPTWTVSPTCTPTSMPSPTHTPASTPTAAYTSTSTPSPTYTPTPTPTPTLSPSPVPSPEPRIAFSAQPHGSPNIDIYSMAPNGDDVTQLTTHLADDRAPDWSPDGQYIAFHSSRDGDYDIYIMDRRGESHYLRKVTDDPEDDWNDYDASWSPDGRQIAFMSERHGNRELYVMNINGSHVRRLTQTERDEKQPAWCPGEDSIAFERRTGRPQVYLMDVNDKSEIALTDSLGRNSSPKWSPDGQRIVFASTRDPENTENAWPEIYVMHRSGAEQTRLTFNSADDDAPAWSPDGEWIVFASKHLDCPGRPDDEDCDWDLFIVRAHGSTPRPLTNSPDLSEYNPVWWGP